MPYTILFVEDEANLLNSLSFILTNDGYIVIKASSGEEAIQLLENNTPQLAILDINLPGIDGYEIAQFIRSNPNNANIPIFMLTGRDTEAEMVAALEQDADEYLVKPVNPRVLLAKLKATFRRLEISDSQSISSNFMINVQSHEVTLNGQLIDLTPTEFEILSVLHKTPNTVFSRDDLISHLHGESYHVTDRAIDFQICSLRKKLGLFGANIQTIRGIGYKLKQESS